MTTWYRAWPSTFGVSARSLAREGGSRGAARVADEAAQQLLALLDLGPVGVGEAGVAGVGPPPALEPPQTLGRPGLDRRGRGRAWSDDPQARHAEPGPPRIPCLEVEEALEHRGGTGAVGLA